MSTTLPDGQRQGALVDPAVGVAVEMLGLEDLEHGIERVPAQQSAEKRPLASRSCGGTRPF